MEKLFKEKTGQDFNDFYKKSNHYIKNYLRKYNSYDIDDIITDSYMKLLNSINNFDKTKSNILTYFTNIAENELKYRYKIEQRIPTTSINDLEVYLSDDNEENDEDITERFNALKSFVNGLDDITQKIFNLRYEGKSLKDISEILDIDISITKNKLYHIGKSYSKKNKFKNVDELYSIGYNSQQIADKLGLTYTQIINYKNRKK